VIESNSKYGLRRAADEMASADKRPSAQRKVMALL
jgi:hypothetical protein